MYCFLSLLDLFKMQPYFGLTGGWLTFWVSVACSTDMALFGYDQGEQLPVVWPFLTDANPPNQVSLEV